MLGSLFKNGLRLLAVAGVGAGLVIAYRRLTQSAADSAPASPDRLPATPAPPQNIHDLLPILACPNCKSPLRLNEAESELICDSCRVAYAIEDGIPVLLPDSGRPLSP